MTRMKNIIPLTEARRRLFEIADDVQRPGVSYTFTEHGRPTMVAMSAEEYDSLLDTIEIMEDPKILAKIKKAEDEYAKGEYVTWDEAKRQLGWVVPNMAFVQDAPRAKGKSKKNQK